MPRLSPRERLARARMRDEAAAEAYRREFVFRLTPRETDVLTLYAQGLRRSEIADRLGIKPNTVQGYARSARWMLAARTTTEAVAEAIRRGLLDASSTPDGLEETNQPGATSSDWTR